ncbi:MAG: hypothetical protein ACRD26_06300 [Vicinamibacterales bacterium]
MSFLWVVTGIALAMAVVALIVARRAATRLAQLSEMHWELKYQHLELRRQVDRIPGAEAPAAPAPPPPASPKESFVPLTSLRR